MPPCRARPVPVGPGQMGPGQMGSDMEQGRNGQRAKVEQGNRPGGRHGADFRGQGKATDADIRSETNDLLIFFGIEWHSSRMQDRLVDVFENHAPTRRVQPLAISAAAARAEAWLWPVRTPIDASNLQSAPFGDISLKGFARGYC